MKSLTTFTFLPGSWGAFEGSYGQHKKSNAREASAAYHLHSVHIIDARVRENFRTESGHAFYVLYEGS
jgi:hypothetical protein